MAIRRGILGKQVASAKVTFSDTGETISLSTKGDSANHFFPPFEVGSHEVRLRLDWTDRDASGNPSLDADFIDPTTGKHRRLKGEMRQAHHTSADLTDGSRKYTWSFQQFTRQFDVEVHWLAEMKATLSFKSAFSAQLIRAKKDDTTKD